MLLSILTHILALSDPNLALTLTNLSFKERQPSFGPSEPEINLTEHHEQFQG